MPYLSKRTISSFLRSECLRRLKLDLSPDNSTYQHERIAQNMPPRAVGRPGLRALADAGTEWEIAKVNDLVQTFGLVATLGNHVQLPTGGVKFNDAPLAQVIQRASPGTFLVQMEYGVGATFESALNIGHYRHTFNLGYADLRPPEERAVLPSLLAEHDHRRVHLSLGLVHPLVQRGKNQGLFGLPQSDGVPQEPGNRCLTRPSFLPHLLGVSVPCRLTPAAHAYEGTRPLSGLLCLANVVRLMTCLFAIKPQSGPRAQASKTSSRISG